MLHWRAGVLRYPHSVIADLAVAVGLTGYQLCHSRKCPTNKALFAMAKLASRYSKNWGILYYYIGSMSSNRAPPNSVTI